MHTLPSDRDALHGVRQTNDAGTLRTLQPEIRADNLQLRFLRSRREFFNGHMSRLSWRPLASQDTDAMSPHASFRCAAENGRYPSKADIDQTGSIKLD